MKKTTIGAGLALLILFGSRPAAAQDPLGWNSERALGLIDRARDRRELPRGDSTLQNYQAKANGFVYFYLDRREENERTLVKVDQIALDLFWKRPNLTKQRIVGLRDVSRLPNRMYYHLDHLTVVQNNLGDVIKIGDGDEVRDVPHPAAPGADTIYDYRLADSVTLKLGGDQADVRVYEVQVRPKRTDRPAFVGSVYVDRDAADLVRMTFTFTPASYVDRRLDYINISLDNGLFGGKYWLPNEQSVEIRRQIPELDFAAGAVIKGRMLIASYTFNEPIPDSVFYGRPVTAARAGERENYPFPDDIYAGVNAEGLAPPPQMEDLRKRAAELLGESKLSGLPPYRLYIPNASSVLRRNDAEGWYGGLGATYAPSPTFRVDVTGGYAFGLKEPEATVAVHLGARPKSALLRAYYNEPRDVGIVPGVPGAMNTLSVTFGGRDYAQLLFTRGVSAELSTGPLRGWRPFIAAAAEQQRVTWQDRETAVPLSATAGSLSEHSYEVNPHSGRVYELRAGVRKPLDSQSGFTWGGEATLSGMHFDGDGPATSPADEQGNGFGRVLIHAVAKRTSEDKRRDLFTSATLGRNISGPPGQYHFRIGGRETLPGYHYRSILSARDVALGRIEYSHTVAAPWLRLRALGYAGATTGIDLRVEDDRLMIEDGERRVRGSAGIGAGLLWDVLRVDLVKGAHWQTIFSVRHDFWDLL